MIAMGFPYGETVVLHRKTVKPPPNRFSTEEIISWEDETLEGVAVSISKSNETFTDGSTRTVTNRFIRVRGHVDIASGDEMTVRGVRYSVDGETSGAQINPLTGTHFGSRIDLRSVNG